MRFFVPLCLFAICSLASPAFADDAASNILLEPGGGSCNMFQANVNMYNRSQDRPIVANICYHKNGKPVSIKNVFIAPGQTRQILPCDFGDAQVCGARYYTGHPVKRTIKRKIRH